MILCAGVMHAQTLDELKSMAGDKSARVAELQAEIDAINGELGGLESQIDKLSGWRKGLGGIFGLDFSNANRWGGEAVIQADADGSIRSLGIAGDISGYLLKDTEKTFWHNNLKVIGNYKDLDLASEDATVRGDDLLDPVNRVADLFNISSLAGYKLSEKFAISAIGDLNTTLLDGNFFNPAVIDLGIGATWLPIDNLTVSLFPLGYSTVIRRDDPLGLEGSGTFGLKYKVTYFDDIVIAGKPFHWDTNLTGFVPYSETDNPNALGNSYWQWLNNVSFQVWNGIGVGFGFGFREADFQALDATSGDSQLQSYTTSVSYTHLTLPTIYSV